MYVIHVGFSGFPVGNASNQRVRFTFKAVKDAGFTPIIINKQNKQQKLLYEKNVHRFDGIMFLYTSPKFTSQDSFFKRNFSKVQGLIGEFRFLYKRRKKISSLILYTQYFSELLYYRILSKLFGFHVVFQYVEHRSSIAGRDSFTTKLNDRLFERNCTKLSDGVIVISEFLREEIRKQSKTFPIIKIPAICDFHDFEKIPAANPGYNYFLYCGTLSYIPVISFVLSFFEKAKDEKLYDGKLMYVLGNVGYESFEPIEKLFSESRYSQDIIFYKNLPYNNIIPLYKSADLLLIPLRNIVQDIARFPHKVSEYTASARPLISTNVGELKHYFVNNESALLADEYDVDKFVETLRQMKEKNISLDEIGRKGYEVGYNNFHFESNTQGIKNFLNNL